jgi:VIT1/CCC1 family predicted Fe2+/Mn2+ transporter
MASSEYLSARSEGRDDALKSCTYTGVAYCITVALLVAPYLMFGNDSYIEAMVLMLVLAVLIILVFTYYISVAKDLNFKKRFLEMAGISLSVALISFVIGIFVKEVLGIDM